MVNQMYLCWMISVIRVLYVDDDLKFGDFFSIYLGKQGDFSIRVIQNGQEALILLRSEVFDIIISDYQMPEMDGLSLLRSVRASGITTPFILFTGKGREEVVIEAINSGVTYYLQKGGDNRATFAELAHKILLATSSKQAADALRESEQRYRELADLLPESVFEADLNGTLTYVNRIAREKFGVDDTADISAFSIFDFISLDDHDLTRTLLQEIITTGRDIPHEYAVMRRDGTRFPVIIHSSPISSSGVPVGIRGVIIDMTRQKQAEEALLESKRRLSDIIQFLPDATFVVNKEGVVTAWNHAIEELTGVPARMMIGKGDHSYSIPFYGVKRDILIDHALLSTNPEEEGYLRTQREGDVIFGESYIPGLKGGIYLWSIATPLMDARGTVVGAIESGRDITARVKSEDELNRARIELEERVAVRTAELLELNRTMISEIDERRHAEEALRESEERYRRLVELFPDAIMVYDGTKIVYVNPAGVHLLGAREVGEIIGFPLQRFLSLPSVIEDIFSLSRYSADSGPVIPLETRMTTIPGDQFYAEISVLLITYKHDPALLMVIRDITRRKEAEARLREYADEMVDKNKELDFITNQLIEMNHQLDKRVSERTREVSRLLHQKDMLIHQLGHDLKTPLTPLIALLPDIARKEDNPEQKEILLILLRSVYSIRDHVEKILLIARLNRDDTEVIAEPVRILPVLRNIVQDHTISIGKKNLEIVLEVPDDTLILFSPRDASIVFDNLISNAVKYSYEGGSIRVHGEKAGDEVSLSFEDTGVGLTEDEALHVFDDFYMADDSRHDRGSSGLGLSIVRRLVGLYGGTVMVTSRGKGFGCTFTLSLRSAVQP